MHRRIRSFTAIVVSVVALAGAAASPALAAVPNPTMSSSCANGVIYSEAPDIHWLDSRWAVQYRFRIQRYTSAGWQAYYTSPYRWHYASDWQAPGWYQTAAPGNTYMRTIVDQYYYYNGVYQGSRVTVPYHSSAAYVLATTGHCRTN
jgi:hypothetical protein